jgi:hypothetical protein
MFTQNVPLKTICWCGHGWFGVSLLLGVFFLGTTLCQGESDNAAFQHRIDQLSCHSSLNETQKAGIRDELSHREMEHLLIAAYPDADECQKSWIVEALYLTRPRQRIVGDFMRSLVSARTDKETWFALEYLAQAGDRKALEQLKQNCYQYQIPSFAWGETLVLFGKYRYHPAGACLIRALGSAAGNQARQALQMWFPGSLPRFASTEEEQEYFQKRMGEINAVDAQKHR